MVTDRKVAYDGTHGRCPDVGYVLLEVVDGEAGVVRVPDAEEEGAGDDDRDIVVCEAGQPLDVHLKVSAS